eukprot:6989717-Alexandrium_andersonii.AAC.1
MLRARAARPCVVSGLPGMARRCFTCGSRACLASALCGKCRGRPLRLAQSVIGNLEHVILLGAPCRLSRAAPATLFK